MELMNSTNNIYIRGALLPLLGRCYAIVTITIDMILSLLLSYSVTCFLTLRIKNELSQKDSP